MTQQNEIKPMAAEKPYFDQKGQWDRVFAYVVPGETLHAVFDCKGSGTGFVGVTDQRVIFYDQGILLKKKAMGPFRITRSSEWCRRILERFFRRAR